VGGRDVDRIGQTFRDLDQLDGRISREHAAGLDGASARPAALDLVERRGQGGGRGVLGCALQSAAEQPSPADGEHEHHCEEKLDARHGGLLS
jgi:hypothetical protein